MEWTVEKQIKRHLANIGFFRPDKDIAEIIRICKQYNYTEAIKLLHINLNIRDRSDYPLGMRKLYNLSNGAKITV